MKTRTLTGTVNDLTGQPYKGLNIPITLVPLSMSYDQMTNVPQGVTMVTTDPWGQFSADLWVGDWALHQYYYSLRLPGEEVPFYFLAGAPIDLAEIRKMQSTEIDPKVLGLFVAHLLNNDPQAAARMPASDVYQQLLVRLQTDMYAVIDARIAKLKGDLNYKHLDNENFAEQVWTVRHKLGKEPSVDCFGADGGEIKGKVKHTNDSQLTITFDEPVSGIALCN